MKTKFKRIIIALTSFAMLSTLSFTTAQGADTVTTELKAPKEIVGIPALPFTGLKAATFTTPTDAPGSLAITPQTALVGGDLTITGKSLPANTPVQLVWVPLKTQRGQWK